MTRTIRYIGAMCAVLFLAVASAPAQDFAALARLDPDRSSLKDARRGAVELTLALSRPVPWRVRLLDKPRRAVLDFRTVEFGRLDPDALGAADGVGDLRAGAFQGGWSRLVLDLDGPMGVERAEMQTEGVEGQGALLRLRLVPVTEAAFALAAAAPAPVTPEAQILPPPPRRGQRPGALTVMLDPGHGGVDPGAVRDGYHEADITLAFARTLRDDLRRRGFQVGMTRDADTFVSLEGRIAVARRAGADVFLSIHADAIAEGIARGAQVWTLSDEASSRAAALLAERHNRSDLLAGLDLSGQDDSVAQVLMEIARTETEPRTDALADALVAGLAEGGIRMHTRPRERAALAVLKAPDIPSALVEIGFMSSPGELEKLLSEEWRLAAAAALADGLVAWRQSDAARAVLIRR
ncbi:MAG: N-acetylmuramoyl-L-alanine amidase [Pseudomonadota bacterium]